MTRGARGRGLTRASLGKAGVFFLPSGQDGPVPPRRSRLARRAAWELWARAQRSRFFSPRLFGDAAWTILLTLYLLRESRAQVSRARLAEHCALPRPAALRWLDHLQDLGLVVPTRRGGGGTLCVRLSGKAAQALDVYLAGVSGERSP